MNKRAMDLIDMIIEEARGGGYVEFELGEDDIEALEQLLEEEGRDGDDVCESDE